MRVLQVVDTLGMGGAETWLLETLRYWSTHNMGCMEFLLTSGEKGIFDDEAQRLGATLHYVPFQRRTLRRFATEFRRILSEGRFHAIHDHQAYASGWHFLIGAGLLPPVRVTHVHNPSFQILNNYGVSPSRRLASRVGRHLVARFATHVAATSGQVLSEYGFDTPLFDRLPRQTLHCGFDPGRFIGDIEAARTSVREEVDWPSDAQIILFAGRLDQSAAFDDPQNHKNSAFAVSVIIECARRNSGVHALFAGKPSQALPALEKRIAEAGLANRVRFLGIRMDIARLMLGSDALLFPSRGEGLGMVAVESQAAGLPVLASTAVPRECVVVPDLVEFESLTASIPTWTERLLRLAARERSVIEPNRAVANSVFSIEHSASALLRLYQGHATS